MEIKAKYNHDLSMDYSMNIFSQDEVVIDHDFLNDLIDNKLLKGVDTQHLPTEFTATILVKMFGSKSEISIFNNEIQLSETCYEEQFLNINLIKRAQENNGSL